MSIASSYRTGRNFSLTVRIAAVLMFAWACAPLLAQESPTIQEIRQKVEAKQYQDALKQIASVLNGVQADR